MIISINHSRSEIYFLLSFPTAVIPAVSKTALIMICCWERPAFVRVQTRLQTSWEYTPFQEIECCLLLCNFSLGLLNSIFLFFCKTWTFPFQIINLIFWPFQCCLWWAKHIVVFLDKPSMNGYHTVVTVVQLVNQSCPQTCTSIDQVADVWIQWPWPIGT